MRNSKGNAAIIFILLVIGFFLVGNSLFSVGKFLNNHAVNDPDIPASDGSGGYTCCDSGDGDECKLGDKKITFSGQEYALIKSNIALAERFGHISPRGTTDDGKQIMVNSTNETYPKGYPDQEATCKAGEDFVLGGSGKSFPCVGIPNDEVIFVCESGCEKPTVNPGGEDNGIFSAYFRVADKTIPDVIKNCEKPKDPAIPQFSKGEQELVIPTDEPGKKNLQLRSFGIKTIRRQSFVASWLSPYCKPAIYLYPEIVTPVSVKLNSIGRLTLTIPNYPHDGWKVIANPNGEIVANGALHDYLYYETEIPDEKIEKPTHGFVVKKNELLDLFNNILPKLGLNTKEARQFSEYWTAALPESPYYFIGIIPQEALISFTSFDISPKPTTTIRVTLFFEALNTPISIPKPNISSHFRQGFTVVEWGGIFKKDANHPFSCFQ